MISDAKHKELIELANKAYENAYVPYSKFKVGAALMTEEGDIFMGCNVENISFPLCNCAERTTIYNMVSEKGPHAKIKAIAVASKADIPLSPCGGCRQVILEFSTPDTVVIFKEERGYVSANINQLLPSGFTEFVTEDQDGSTTHIHSGE